MLCTRRPFCTCTYISMRASIASNLSALVHIYLWEYLLLPTFLHLYVYIYESIYCFQPFCTWTYISMRVSIASNLSALGRIYLWEYLLLPTFLHLYVYIYESIYWSIASNLSALNITTNNRWLHLGTFYYFTSNCIKI